MFPFRAVFHITFFCLTSVCAVSTAAAEQIKIVYEDRAPYYETVKDGVRGLVLTPVSDALKLAGLNVRWATLSAKRQMAAVKSNREAVCSPGWFKKPEREEFAKFSDAVYQDRPQTILVRTDNVSRMTHSRLEQLFLDKKFRLGVKNGYSYGSYIDKLLALKKPTIIDTTQNVDGMMRMLLAARFDYFFVAPEEYQSLLARTGVAASDVLTIDLQDIPPGNARYLMCSMKVPAPFIERFNTALRIVRMKKSNH